ncbi:Crp/Fnr family transcriptional regulator [Streptomyces xiamenensis]
MYQPHSTVIGEQLWSKLCGLSPVRVRQSRSVLLRQGDPGTHVVLLAAGTALVTLTGAEGNRTLLAVRGSGEIFGELAVVDAQPRSASVIAAETCRVHIVAAADFLGFVEEHQLLNSLLRHAITRVREAEAVRLELATAPVATRLASALGRLAQWVAAPGQPAQVRLTQEELAQMIGASRNAVGSALKSWREHGWLDTEAGGGLLIKDIAAIQEHVGAQT